MSNRKFRWTAEVQFGVFMVGALLACVTLAYMFSYTDCKNYAEVTGRNYDFRVIGGCFIETDEGWFLKDQIYTQEVLR